MTNELGLDEDQNTTLNTEDLRARIERAVGGKPSDIMSFADELAKLAPTDRATLLLELQEKFRRKLTIRIINTLEQSIKAIQRVKMNGTAPQKGVPPDPNEVSPWTWIKNPHFPTHGMYRNIIGPDGFLITRLAIKQVLEVIEILETPEGVAGATVRVTPRSGNVRECFIPSSVVTSAQPAPDLREVAPGFLFTPKEAREVQEWLAYVLSDEPGFIHTEGMTRPGWKADKIVLPGGNIKLIPTMGGGDIASYGQKDPATTEKEAIEAWREIVKNLVKWPRLATYVGAGLASVYLKPTNHDSFIAHSWGESTLGKTMGAKIAMSLWGNPDSLLKSWNATPRAMSERLSRLAILPALYDETGAGNLTPQQMASTVFDLSTGTSRDRALRNGGIRDTLTWNNTVLSTGETRLTISGGATGLRARVLELKAPLSDRSTNEYLLDLASKFYGWPCHWLRESPELELYRTQMLELRKTLEGKSTIDISRRLCKHVAATFAGIGVLARLCDQELEPGVLLKQAEIMLLEIESEISAAGEKVSDRLYQHIHDTAGAKPFAFPDAKALRERGEGSDGLISPINLETDTPETVQNEYLGVRDGDLLFVFVRSVPKIAGEIGIVDFRAAIVDMIEKEYIKDNNVYGVNKMWFGVQQRGYWINPR